MLTLLGYIMLSMQRLKRFLHDMRWQ